MKMKPLALLLSMTLAGSVSGQLTEESVRQLFEQRDKAISRNDTDALAAQFETYAADNIVMVLIDFPKDKSLVPEKYTERNGTLKEQYGITGYPTFVLLKIDGTTEFGRLKAGKQKPPESFIDEVKALLNTEEGQ